MLVLAFDSDLQIWIQTLFIHSFYSLSGDHYEGAYELDKRCGVGTYFYVDTGNTYTGDWLDDVKHGEEKLRFRKVKFDRRIVFPSKRLI
jgi:hypothetical protein